jgi:hypothetical protein
MLGITCGYKTDMDDGSSSTTVKIGSFLCLRFGNAEKAESFLLGYRSGMARIWRTTFVLPTKTDTLFRRGFRFAWWCHLYGIKHARDQFPEAYIVNKNGEKNNANN